MARTLTAVSYSFFESLGKNHLVADLGKFRVIFFSLLENSILCV